MSPSWLEVEARVQRRTLQKHPFCMGGVSKIKDPGNNRGTKDTNFTAKMTWFEERSEEKEYRNETNTECCE